MKLYEYNKEEINKFYNHARQEYSEENIKKREYGMFPVKGDPRAGKVGWTSKENQYSLYQELINIGVKNGDTILDFGCGIGDMFGYCKKINLEVNYIGVDINEGHISDAKKEYQTVLRHLNPFRKASCKFYIIDTIDDVEENYDWFFASGSFTLGFEFSEIMDVLSKAYMKARKGVAFNLLTNLHAKFNGGFYKTKYYGAVMYDPDWVLQQLRKKFPNAYSKDAETPTLTSAWGQVDDYTFYIKK